MSAATSHLDRRRHRATLLAVALALAVAGCTSDTGGSDLGFVVPEEGAADVTVDGAPEATADAPDDPDAPDVDADDANEPEVDTSPPRFPADVPAIELLTAGSGGGERPELAWEAVPGASSYAVTLYVGVGEPAYWAWRGEEAAVVVGGLPDRAAGGPRVRPGMTWSVQAFGADGALLAQSGERPIGP